MIFRLTLAVGCTFAAFAGSARAQAAAAQRAKADSAFAFRMVGLADSAAREMSFFGLLEETALAAGLTTHAMQEQFLAQASAAAGTVRDLKNDVEVMNPPDNVARIHTQFTDVLRQATIALDSFALAPMDCSRFRGSDEPLCEARRGLLARRVVDAQADYAKSRDRLRAVLWEEKVILPRAELNKSRYAAQRDAEEANRRNRRADQSLSRLDSSAKKALLTKMDSALNAPVRRP